MNRRKGTTMRRIRLTLVLSAALLVAPVMALGKDSTVEISHGSLSPSEVSIHKGERVTFANSVAMPGGHSVVADDDSFASPPLEKGQTWDHTFEKTGSFAYHVKEHPGAKGVIHVK